jgi:hypothetical protein
MRRFLEHVSLLERTVTSGCAVTQDLASFGCRTCHFDEIATKNEDKCIARLLQQSFATRPNISGRVAWSPIRLDFATDFCNAEILSFRAFR